jgi:zeaxanthin glucosyltransferase
MVLVFSLVAIDRRCSPQVASPLTNDPPGVAARIAAYQTGVVVSLGELTVSRLSSLIDEVLNN